MNKLELQKTANEVRKGIVTAVHSAKAGHPGGSLSAADIFTYLYFEELNIDPKNPKDPDRDRFVLSKGHTAPGYYSASMTTTWHFETGDAASYDAYVANVAENTNDVYFDIFLAEQEDEPIYQSPVIPRGSELDEIILDKSLDAGTHDCILIYHLVDGEQKTVSTLRVALTIIVEN